MVVTLFVSDRLTCRIFMVGHSNFDTKYPYVSTTNSNVLQLYHIIHYLISNARSAIVTTNPTTRVCCNTTYAGQL